MNYLDGVLIAMHIANEELGYGGNHGGDCDGFIEHLLGAIGEEELVARAEEMGQMELSGLRKYFSGVRDES